MPFYGRAHVAYVPQSGQVVGLSKFARITQVFSARMQTPDALASQLVVRTCLLLRARLLLSCFAIPAPHDDSPHDTHLSIRPRNTAVPEGAQSSLPG
jgi:hypothetical protein